MQSNHQNKCALLVHVHCFLCVCVCVLLLLSMHLNSRVTISVLCWSPPSFAWFDQIKYTIVHSIQQCSLFFTYFTRLLLPTSTSNFTAFAKTAEKCRMCHGYIFTCGEILDERKRPILNCRHELVLPCKQFFRSGSNYTRYVLKYDTFITFNHYKTPLNIHIIKCGCESVYEYFCLEMFSLSLSLRVVFFFVWSFNRTILWLVLTSNMSSFSSNSIILTSFVFNKLNRTTIITPTIY